ncbi:MAG TPA: MauE/DoxX family redox-associated membrane protein, partial [Myxococcales bacterium]|nr:MauE/DoxX family redox-associated membrane protein [Myxococcales bacterium]
PHAKGFEKGLKFARRGVEHNLTPIVIGLAAVVVLTLAWLFTGSALFGILQTWFRLGMAALFIAACWYKLANPQQFATAVAQYRMLPAPLVDLFALWLPALELVVALGLVFTRWTREFSALLALLWVMFIVALGEGLLRRLGITCGCFNIAEAYGSTGETWFALQRDVVLLVPTLFLAAFGRQRYLWQRR